MGDQDGRQVHTLARLPEFDRERVSALNTRLEALVTRGSGLADKSSLLWASALFDTDADGVIRHWRVFETVCDNDTDQRRTFPSVGLAVTALSQEGKQSVETLNKISESHARRYCDESAIGTKLSYAQELGQPAVNAQTVRLPYMFWPARLDPFRFGTGRTSDGKIAPLLDIRSAGTILEREKLVAASYASSTFCESITIVTPLPLTCEAVQGRVVIIGSSHRDSRDLHFTPLGAMPGAYVLANTIAGSRDTLMSPRSISSDARFWGVALFVCFVLLAARLRNLFAVIFGALLALTFLSIIANWFSIPASRSYESVNIAIVMIAIFLGFAAIAPDAEKWSATILGHIFRRHGERR